MSQRLILLTGLLLVNIQLAGAADDAVAHTFTHGETNATTVGVAGEFSNWRILPMAKDETGNWTKTLQLKPGVYAYKIVINELDWIFDPNNPARKTVNDIENSAVAIGGAQLPQADVPAAVSVEFSHSDAAAKAVVLAGEFNAWSTTANPMQQDDKGKWQATLLLKPGRYQYKFVVDGNWKTDPNNPETADDGLGGKNSVRIVKP